MEIKDDVCVAFIGYTLTGFLVSIVLIITLLIYPLQEDIRSLHIENQRIESQYDQSIAELNLELHKMRIQNESTR